MPVCDSYCCHRLGFILAAAVCLLKGLEIAGSAGPRPEAGANPMNVTVGIWGVVILVLLLLGQVPVAIALIAVAFGGITFLPGFTPALGILVTPPTASWRRGP